MAEKTTQIRVSPNTAAKLREIAAAFEYYTGRGIGAGEMGNTAEMLDVLVEHYQRNPPATLLALSDLLTQGERRNGIKEQ